MGHVESARQHHAGRAQLATRLAAAGAQAVGARRAAEYLGSRKLLFEPSVSQEIERPTMTELLELPFWQDQWESCKDALAETILSAPEL